MPFYLIYASGLQLPQLTSLPIISKPRTHQVKVRGFNLIDGGVAANNPTL
ncbi:hypothetical protein OIU84_015704, partial [Salix udensis]